MAADRRPRCVVRAHLGSGGVRLGVGLLRAGVELGPLTRRQRAQVGSAYRATPATLVAWAAKAVDADVDATVLLRHADAIAQTVTRLQATCVLALDPFGEDTAELWKERYGFKPVASALEAGAAASDRLWVSLDGLSR